MKTYMALDGLRWSRDSGSVHCNMPRSAVFGRSGGGVIAVVTVPTRGPAQLSNMLSLKYFSIRVAKIQKNFTPR